MPGTTGRPFFLLKNVFGGHTPALRATLLKRGRKENNKGTVIFIFGIFGDRPILKTLLLPEFQLTNGELYKEGSHTKAIQKPGFLGPG